MPFVHPIVFWTGLGAVSIPILIHLLNRRRFRLMDWAAMRFLWESVRKNRRRLRIEELILLALRCLVLLVLAVTLSRFTGCRAMQDLPGGTESRTVVFLLDDSYSMGQRVGAGDILAAATTDLADQVAKLAQTDKLAILLTSQDANDEPFFKLTHLADAEVEQLTVRLNALEATDGRARLDRALAAAGRTFQGDKNTARRLVIYGDFRRVDLSGGGSGDAIRGEFDKLRKQGIEVVAMDFGRRPKSNLTIESITLVDKYALAKVPARVRLEVRNHGEAMARDVEVRLTAKFSTADGLRDVELPAAVIESIDRRGTGRAEFQIVCPSAGPAVVAATLPPDELPADNAAHLALEVRDALRVLAADGHADLADPTEGESFFLVHALDPDRNGSEGTKVEVLSPTAMGDVSLSNYDLVAMVNVGELPVVSDANGQPVCPQLEALADFVRDGGGLAIFTGDRVNLTFYNGPFFADGSGLSPLRMGPRKGSPDDKDHFYRLDPKSIASAGVLRTLNDFLAAGADPTRFIRFYAFTGTNPITPPAATPDVRPPRVLAKFADEDHSAAVVSRQFGKGTVLAVYTTASMRWNDWPADENGTFVAVLNDMVAYLAKPQSGGLSERVGEPIIFSVPAGMRDVTATLKSPRHPIEPVVPLVPVGRPGREGAGARELRYEHPRRAGLYTLELSMPDGTTRQAFFSRTVDPLEGDLTCDREAGLAAALGSEEFVYLDRTAAATGQVAQAQTQKEYWTWALAILAALLAVETFLAQRFGHYPGGGKGTAGQQQATVPR